MSSQYLVSIRNESFVEFKLYEKIYKIHVQVTNLSKCYDTLIVTEEKKTTSNVKNEKEKYTSIHYSIHGWLIKKLVVLENKIKICGKR